ncbi:hypothetical protein AB0D12_34290 [Streptomyces sp. NPDC048479]|uniref:hypothetical protein n=1 Tax=Streptomyces sp. NPDC048479 TaxID=3154725 RepID=UPI003419B053
MPGDLSPVIAAATRWLLTAFPAAAGAMNYALAEAQARQAAAVAAALRYPTTLDIELLNLVGPGGSDRLESLTGADQHNMEEAEESWRTWVDETVVSWAANLLTDPCLAATAEAALSATEHGAGSAGGPRRLTIPSPRDHQAAPLLRHPDLLSPINGFPRAPGRLRTGGQLDHDRLAAVRGNHSTAVAAAARLRSGCPAASW